MIKITNGTDVFEVSRGAYTGIYSKQGYVPVEDVATAGAGNVQPPEKSDDELFLEEIVETPVSQWSKADLKRFAALKGIDISGTKNAGEAKELVKNWLESEM